MRVGRQLGNSGLGDYAFYVGNFYRWKGLGRVWRGPGRYNAEFDWRKAGYGPAFVIWGLWF